MQKNAYLADVKCQLFGQWVKESEGQFECLGENTEKYKNFSVPIEFYKVDKDGNENIVTKSYKIKFINSVKLMASSFQILLIILRKEFTKLNVKILIVFLI